jgi:hypothetical protein
MLLNQALRLSHLPGLQAKVRGKFDRAVDPKLRFAVGMLHMDMCTSLFA